MKRFMPMDSTSEMNEQLQEDTITKAQEAIENIKNSYISLLLLITNYHKFNDLI